MVLGLAIPEEESFLSATRKVHNLLLGLGNRGVWRSRDRIHHRGPGFVAVNMGMGVGTGNPPYNQSNSGHEEIVDILLQSQELKRLAVYQSGEPKCCLDAKNAEVFR